MKKVSFGIASSADMTAVMIALSKNMEIKQCMSKVK